MKAIIQVTNQSADYNYTLSTQLKRRFGDALNVSAAYTYMQSKDFQSLTSDRAISNWRNGRVFAGLENDVDDVTTSYFERPHRVILYGSYTCPGRRPRSPRSTKACRARRSPTRGRRPERRRQQRKRSDLHPAERARFSGDSHRRRIGHSVRLQCGAGRHARTIPREPGLPRRPARADHGAQQLPQSVAESSRRRASPAHSDDSRSAADRAARRRELPEPAQQGLGPDQAAECQPELPAAIHPSAAGPNRGRDELSRRRTTRSSQSPRQTVHSGRTSRIRRNFYRMQLTAQVQLLAVTQ